MKKFYLLLCVIVPLFCKGQEPIPQASVFLNLGNSVPLGQYRASASSDRSLEISRASGLARNFNLGVDVYPFNWFGFTSGLSVSNFELDHTTFEKLHHPDAGITDSYLRDHKNINLYAGITTRFNWRRFYFGPRFTVGLSTFTFGFADLYLKNPEGEISHTINYQFISSNHISYNTGFHGNYEIVANKPIRIAIQLYLEASFQRPEITVEKTESDVSSETIISTKETYRQSITFFYYGFGFALKI